MKKNFWFLVFSLLIVAFLRSNFSYINENLLAQLGGGGGDSSNFTLKITKTGNGGGLVSSSSGINCGDICSLSVVAGSSVNLNATADSGSVFTSWLGGGCSGNGNCNISNINSDLTINAQFDLNSSSGGGGGPPPGGGGTQKYTLTINKIDHGDGTVKSSPDGINCGSICHFSFTNGAQIKLDASPNNDSSFIGFFGDGCFGNSTCTTIINADKKIDAQFKLLSSTSTEVIFSNHPIIKYLTKNAAATNDENIESIQISAQGNGIFKGAILVLSLNDNYVVPSGSPDVFGAHNDQDTAIDSGIVAVFNLKDQPAGLYDVAVFNSDGQSSILPKAFNLVSGPITPRYFRDRLKPTIEFISSFFNSFETPSPVASPENFVTEQELPKKILKTKPKLLSRLSSESIQELSAIPTYEFTTTPNKLAIILRLIVEHLVQFKEKLKSVL